MKKEEILEMHFGSDYWMLDAYKFKEHILNAMKEYANDQIEKDRQRVIVNMKQDQGYGVIDIIENTPIILD